MDLTAERLRELLDYSPEIGVFTWKKRVRQRPINGLAGSAWGRYVNICISQKLYYAHRLAWLYVHGEWPAKHLDHIDGNGHNNRIVNLRLATRSENLCNTKARTNNVTGFKGVFPHKKKFAAQIKKDGVRWCLGNSFDTPEEAHAAYCEAARRLHGEFAGSLIIMSGSLFGLPMSQRVDLNGKPSVSWRLYLYQANTSTPVQSYQDTALTVLNPWPVVADAYGMIPPFWLADGNYRARATSADGSLTYFDQFSILALGASSGAAPSGGVDPAAIAQTGDTKWRDIGGALTGWVIDNGTTIGSATSGASQRPNADCQPLFELLWNNFSDALCPVVTGRGGSSLSDWTANKQITLLDKRGCTIIGADQMGSTSSGNFTTVPVVTGTINTPGSTVGGNNYSLLTADIPAHTHTGSGNTANESVQHTHTQLASVSTGSYSVGGSSGPLGNGSQTGTESALHTHFFSFTSDPTGGGGAHNNTQRSIIGTWYRKL